MLRTVLYVGPALDGYLWLSNMCSYSLHGCQSWLLRDEFTPVYSGNSDSLSQV